jgi:tetratricopeptide (TPR) repeat protein
MMPLIMPGCQRAEQDSQQQLLEKARENLEAGNFNVALVQLSQALDQDPGNLEVHKNLAWLYLYTDNLEKASEEINTITRLDPDNSDLHYLRGYLYAELEQWVDALESYNEALKTEDVNNPNLHFDIATAFLAVNEPEAALKEFDLALRLQPGNSSYEFGKCMTYRQLKQYSEALQYCQDAKLHTDSAEEKSRIDEVMQSISLLQMIDSGEESTEESTTEWEGESSEPTSDEASR